jgi:hypothetical protein
MTKLFTLLVLLAIAAPALATTCPSGTYDMLDWMTMDLTLAGASHLEGGGTSQYTGRDPINKRFYWIKGSGGFPWDVNTYTSTGIYQWITEQNWSDPTTYKNFEIPILWSPRCVPIPQLPGKLTTVLIPSSQTWYDIHTSCSTYTRQNLKYIVNDVWGPYRKSMGGDLPPNTPTLELSYRWGCDSAYSNCSNKEVFSFQKKYGLVRWTHYQLQNGSFVMVQQSDKNMLVPGATTAYHPCW